MSRPGTVALLVLAGIGALLVAGSGGCGAVTGRADATLELSVPSPSDVADLSTQVMNLAPSWGATRVGETSEEGGDVATLTFSLPGPRLDQAVTALENIDGAEVVSTDIAVDFGQIDRAAAEPEPVELQVVMESRASPSGGAGPLLRLVMALFSVVGMLALAWWAWERWQDRRDERLPSMSDGAVRRVRRPVTDLRDGTDRWGDGHGPDTQENPTIPRS